MVELCDSHPNNVFRIQAVTGSVDHRWLGNQLVDDFSTKLTELFKDGIKMAYLNNILNMKSRCNIDQLIFGALFHLLILQMK